MRRILLDTNMLVACFDTESTSSEAECIAAKNLLKNLVQDPDVVFVITPLIRYEVLRFAKWMNPQHFNQLKPDFRWFHRVGYHRACFNFGYPFISLRPT